MTRILFCALTAMLAFAACGNETAPATPAAAQAEAQPAAPQSVPAAEAEPRVPVNELQQPAGTVDGETIDTSTSTTSAVAAAVAANTPTPPQADLARWKAGEHYTVYPVAQRVSVAPGNVEVLEGFWYGCGHCYSLEPRLEAFEKTKPEWLKLKRVPVIWNEVTKEDARIYYTLEGLGLVDKLHVEVYRRIHGNGGPLTVVRGNRVDLAATEKAVRDFLRSKGVADADFAKQYRTFSTENKLRQAQNQSRNLLLDHTPMVVINGKYLTDVSMAGGNEELFQLINDLAARERAAN